MHSPLVLNLATIYQFHLSPAKIKCTDITNCVVTFSHLSPPSLLNKRLLYQNTQINPLNDIKLIIQRSLLHTYLGGHFILLQQRFLSLVREGVKNV